MFGGSSTSISKPENSRNEADLAKSDPTDSPPSPDGDSPDEVPDPIKTAAAALTGGNGSPPTGSGSPAGEKKRRSSGVGQKASNFIAHAKSSLSFGSSSKNNGNGSNADSKETSFQKLGRQDPALAVPQGQHNNSAGESLPGPRSTFRVGVWEDRNKKCRRTMEDTHAFLYNFLPTPAPAVDGESSRDKDGKSKASASTSSLDMIETDNGYFAIFDGHAGSFAADWCGKKLHVILEETIRNNPNTPIPQLLDMTFTSVDAQLEKLPSKSSGCTAAIAVLRWEDRVPNDRSATGSQSIAPAAAKVVSTKGPIDESSGSKSDDATKSEASAPGEVVARLRSNATRHRVLYTANVGDARIILCRNGKALRLSYDHKGSDENEGKRIANAGGLIVNNRVNGVLAVTRALGDAYMKDLVTGHPYTTETVIQPETDEFIIIACDGLWDVCSDQEAVDLVRDVEDPFTASKLLVDHALNRFSTDNLSCMIVRLDRAALLEQQNNRENAIGVEGDSNSPHAQQTETEKIVGEAKRRISTGEIVPVGASSAPASELKGESASQPPAPASTPATAPASSQAQSSSSSSSPEEGFKPRLDDVGEEAIEDGDAEDQKTEESTK